MPQHKKKRKIGETICKSNAAKKEKKQDWSISKC
jgi:hypothetical protein